MAYNYVTKEPTPIFIVQGKCVAKQLSAGTVVGNARHGTSVKREQKSLSHDVISFSVVIGTGQKRVDGIYHSYFCNPIQGYSSRSIFCC